MTTARRTAVAVSALAIVTLASFMVGCGGTNQAACERAVQYSLDCASGFGDLPDGADSMIAQICATVPETSECEAWSDYANCITSISCTELVTPDPQTIESCLTIANELQNNNCGPTSPGF